MQIVHRGKTWVRPEGGRAVAASCNNALAREMRPAFEQVSLTGRVNCPDCLEKLAWLRPEWDGTMTFKWPGRAEEALTI